MDIHDIATKFTCFRYAYNLYNNALFIAFTYSERKLYVTNNDEDATKGTQCGNVQL